LKDNRKVGRPKSDKHYRQNVIRVSVMEDMLERMMQQLHPNSSLRKIVKDELEELRIRETAKANKKSVSTG